MHKFQPIWPWIFPLLVISLGLYLAFRNLHWRDDDRIEFWFPLVLGGLATVFIAGISCAIGYGLADTIGSHSEQIWHSCWSGNMVSLRNSDGVSGHISGGLFMLVGGIESRQVYHYYTLKSDGSFQPQHWTPDSDTSVFEEDRKDGQVVQFDEQFKRGWVNWVATPGDRLRMDFHIPKGTLRKNFSLE